VRVSTFKCFDLSKIRAKHPKNLGKISENPGKKWRSTFAEKHMKTFFLEVILKKVFMIFVGENCRQKLHKNFSDKFGEIRGKFLCTPKICLLLHLRLL